MNDLLRRLRAARESWVDVNGHGFLLRRPTLVEQGQLSSKQAQDVLRHIVVGWRAVKESDLIPGGASDEIDFDAELCSEWVADDSEKFGAIMDAVREMIASRNQTEQEAKKNS